MRAADATAPYRADLAGGTLDIWPLGLLHPGAVTVNAALELRVRVRVDDGAPAGDVWHAVGDAPFARLDRDDPHDLTAVVANFVNRSRGFRVRVAAQAPVGSGLGGSSCYAVALARALLAVEDREVPDEDLVAILRDLEARVLAVPTGCQDHWAAVRGGVLSLHLEPGRVRVERLGVDPVWVGERLTVLFSGITHASGMVNWQVIRRRLDGELETVIALEEIAAAAVRCRWALLAGDEAAVGEAIAAEWSARRRLAPEVCPPELAHLADEALTAGAAAVKACGAGGGGSLLLWHPPEQRGAIEAALLAAAPGARVLARGLANEGVCVRQVG